MVAHVIVEGPVLFFGGPYSNLQATRALLAEAEKRGIPAERTVCTGDLVAYCADACATVALAREAGFNVVMGTCEEALACGSGDCGCGFAPRSSCDRLSTAWFAHADRQLGSEDRAWMAGLPRRLDIAFAGTGLTLATVHGGVNEVSRFTFAATPDRVKALDIAGAGVDGIVGGHYGLPFTHSVGGRLWHNPGVIGMPANDGTPRVWFPAVLACTLLVYNPAFELGRTLQEASRSVHLNHPHCARFCVLGGASCSTGGITSSL